MAWQFEQKGFIALAGEDLDFDEVFMTAAEAGAEDVQNEDGTIVVFTPRELFGAVEQALTEAGYVIDESELRWEAKNETTVSVDKALSNIRLLGELEDLDDVQGVASNLAMTDEVIAAYESD